MLNLRRHKKDITIAERKEISVKLLRYVLPLALALVLLASAAGCGQNGSGPQQQSQAALEQLLSCTLQQADDFDTAMSAAFAETTENSEAGLLPGNDEELMEHLTNRFGGSMTDACIKDLAMSRSIYRSAALAKEIGSDIHAGSVELTKRSGEEECYDFSAEIKTSAGNPAAKASGTISMERDGDKWKASHITLTFDEAGGTSDSTADRIASGPACPSVNGALRVDGTQLVDKNGSPVQLRGISTHGLAWFPEYVNEDCFRQLHEEWQANVIRLAMYTAEYGGYCTDGDRDALKQLIDRGVASARRQDMYAVIDWHILSDSNPNTYLEDAKAFFGEMAAKYAQSDHILYEICNEPNGSTSWEEIKAYAEQIIPVIRSQDEDAVILVGTPNWSQYVDQAAADPIASYENIMYTLHFYAATHTDDLRQKLTGAVERGLPVFISEYGICDASGSGAIDTAQADLWVETLDKYGISYIAWNLSDKEESSAMLKSSCGKNSGFTQEDLSESGRWVYQMLRK